MSPTTTPPKPTLDQRRAQHAWKAVEIAKDHEKDFEEFRNQAKRLPMRILAAGLGQALTFLWAKKYAPVLLQATADWVLDKRPHAQSTKEYPAQDALIKAIMHGNADFLRHATDETLAYLRWLVRFADAEAPSPEQPERED